MEEQEKVVESTKVYKKILVQSVEIFKKNPAWLLMFGRAAILAATAYGVATIAAIVCGRFYAAPIAVCGALAFYQSARYFFDQYDKIN